jgi:hypothetical protein
VGHPADVQVDGAKLVSSVAKWIATSIIVVCFCVWYLTPLRSPSHSQMVGEYRVVLPWGNASLHLNEDQTFIESVHSQVGESYEVRGKWSMNAGFQSSLSLQPYWQFTQAGPGNRVESAALPVESWWLRGVQIEFGDFDSDIKLRKQ